MESVPLEMDDIFDGINEDIPMRLPDLEDDLQPMQIEPEEDEDEQDQAVTDPDLLERLKSMKGASKNATKSTGPKLDATRLTGERGIPILPKVFKKVHLKGKNCQVEDLKVIMKHMEHWAHRLFPKMPFFEVLDRVERLGSKKEVQNCVKRIRQDMPVLPGDEVEDDNVQRTGYVSQNYDNEVNNDEIEDMLNDAETDERPDHNETRQPQSPVQSQTVLTDELKAKIEKNRQLALERRKLRQEKELSAENSKGKDPTLHEAVQEIESAVFEPQLEEDEIEALIN